MADIKFDDDQLREIGRLLKPDRSRGASLDDYLRIAQIVALVCGGLWAVFGYLTFERKSQELETERNTIALARDSLSLQRDRLSSAGFALAEAQQRLSRELGIEQQKLSLQSERLGLAYTQLLSVGQEKQNELSTLEIAHQTDHRIKDVHDLRVIRRRDLVGDTAEFEAVVSLQLNNISPAPLEVTYSVTDGYIGAILPLSGSTRMIGLNRPPDLYNPPEPGPIKWVRVARHVNYFGSSQYSIPPEIESMPRPPGGGVTGRLKEGQSTWMGRSFVFRAHEDEYVAFTINVGINGATNDSDVWYFHDILPLSEAESPATRR